MSTQVPRHEVQRILWKRPENDDPLYFGPHGALKWSLTSPAQLLEVRASEGRMVLHVLSPAGAHFMIALQAERLTVEPFTTGTEWR